MHNFIYTVVMQSLNEQQSFLSRTLGSEVRIFNSPQTAQRKLSLALRGRFRYEVMHWNRKEYLLARDRESQASGKTLALKKMQEQLEASFGLPVIFYTASLPFYMQQRYIKAGLSYISDVGQAYITEGIIRTKGRQKSAKAANVPHLNPAAQVILLRHLLIGDIEGKSLTQLAANLPYSKMWISKAKEELVQVGLCIYSEHNRTGKLEFLYNKQELWSRAQSKLRTPVQNTLYLPCLPPAGMIALSGGESALSQMSLLEAPSLPVFATDRKQAMPLLQAAGITPLPDEEEASCVIQLWKYAPHLLVRENDNSIDVLSLILSLQQHDDARIHQELSSLAIPW